MYLKEFAFTAPMNDDVNASPDDLVKSHLRLVYAKASKYRSTDFYDDVVSAGIEELVKLSKSFDASRGVSFASYAGTYIDYAIMHAYAETVRPFNVRKLGKNSRKAYFAYQKYFTEDCNSQDAAQKMAEELGIPLDSVLNMHEMLSYKQVEIPEEDNIETNSYRPDEHLERVELDNILGPVLQSSLSKLNEREKAIIQRRFLTDDSVSRIEIAKEFGCSQQRIAQIESVSLKKLATIMSPYKEMVN